MNDEHLTPPQQLQWYRESISLRDQQIVDAGANVGLLSEFFWEAGGGTNTLLSIEPIPQNVPKIRERIARLGATNWRVESCAVSGDNGELSLRVEEMTEGCWNSAVAPGHEGALRVPCRRLSELAPEATVVKLDIEGHEYSVLAEALPGMPRVHTWAIEFHGGPGRALEQALARLAAHGFQLVAAGRRASDPGGAWVSAPIPPSLSWQQIPVARDRQGHPFQMLHVLARR